MSGNAKDVLDDLRFKLGFSGADATKAIKAFLKGTPEELEAAQEIVRDMISKAEGIEAGTVTSADLDFAREHWQKSVKTLLEAKRLRITKKVADVFLDAVTFYLRRLLPDEED